MINIYSDIDINGGVIYNASLFVPTNTTTNLVITDETNIECNNTSNIQITLPLANNRLYKHIRVSKNNTGNVTVICSGSDDLYLDGEVVSDFIITLKGSVFYFYSKNNSSWSVE